MISHIRFMPIRQVGIEILISAVERVHFLYCPGQAAPRFFCFFRVICSAERMSLEGTEKALDIINRLSRLDGARLALWEPSVSFFTSF